MGTSLVKAVDTLAVIGDVGFQEMASCITVVDWTDEPLEVEQKPVLEGRVRYCRLKIKLPCLLGGIPRSPLSMEILRSFSVEDYPDLFEGIVKAGNRVLLSELVRLFGRIDDVFWGRPGVFCDNDDSAAPEFFLESLEVESR